MLLIYLVVLIMIGIIISMFIAGFNITLIKYNDELQ